MFGRLGDRLGRSRTLVLTILTYAIFTGAGYLAQTWWHLLIFRFLYFIVPLSFAAVLLGLRELRLIAGSAATLAEPEAPPLRKRAPSDCNRRR